MKPAPFDYARADSVDEAIELLAEHGDDARVIAGGQSLMPMLNMRLVRPEILVDISHLDDLKRIETSGGGISIGAGVTQGTLAEWDRLEAELPLVAHALPNVGHFQTRNRGTVCGSICHADPSSELPLCLALLEGEVELRSKRGTRNVKAAEFQQGVLTTDRALDELAVRVTFPAATNGGTFAFSEFHHRHGDFAVVAVAARRDGRSITVAVGGVADRPVVRRWDNLEDAAIDDALNDFAWQLGGSDDIHATAQHRRQLVRHLGRKVIEETAK
jgi:2-furoyl-CoA dehydrogenase FAD binding subunit